MQGSPSVVVEYNLPADANASLELYNSIGNRVGILARGPQARGVHAGEWRAHGAAPGSYLCRMRTNGFDQTRRITLAG